MTIECKLNEVLAVNQMLQEICNNYPKLPINVSFHIADMMSAVEPKVRMFEKKRNELVMELGVTVKVPGEAEGEMKETMTVPPNKIEEFAGKINSLAEVDVTLSTTPISLMLLKDIEISPKSLISCSKFFKE